MNSYQKPEFRFSFGPQRITYSVQLLILLNATAFAAQLLIDIPFGTLSVHDVPGGELLEWLAFSPARLMRGLIWLPVTYMFLHSGLMHLFMNMLMLFFLGPEVERALGTRQFLFFYFLAGVIGVMANFIPILLMANAPMISVIGASGAVMGVTIAFAMINPERQIFLFPIPVPLTARGMVFFLIVMNLIAAVGNSPLSVATHFGGMAVGYVYMKYRPMLMAWQIRRRAPSRKKAEEMRDAVDNIFKLHDRDRK
ncbi:MAG: rhomboid family intramembrane serine protease [Candidatus Hydrogenedentes bacterium]|nr:rhomboid family intramembrane serine protease [Candidatus Hydrogenedentota bacterium]